jgi:aspartyl-tRNA(Asn)/glutamyl-tRNA(Gln) amidotransferase subunit C
MKINRELIDYLGELSRIELTPEEKTAREKDLSEIVDYMGKLDELNTKGVPEMAHPFEENNRFREDVVSNSDRREEMLANAPEKYGDFFKIFATVEE